MQTASPVTQGDPQQVASKPLALLYVRVSTNRQAQTGHSLDSQPAILTAAAVAEGYAVEVITETGSGRNSARPQLTAALARLARGEAAALFALDLDRLARSTKHLIEIMEAANRQQWRLVIHTAKVDTANPIGRAVLEILGAVAQLESGLTSERVKRQHEARRQRGEVWGITSGPTSEQPLEVLNLIESMRAEGKSLAEIARTLELMEIPTARGGQWQHSTVRRLVKATARRGAVTIPAALVMPSASLTAGQKSARAKHSAAKAHTGLSTDFSVANRPN